MSKNYTDDILKAGTLNKMISQLLSKNSVLHKKTEIDSISYADLQVNNIDKLQKLKK